MNRAQVVTVTVVVSFLKVSERRRRRRKYRNSFEIMLSRIASLSDKMWQWDSNLSLKFSFATRSFLPHSMYVLVTYFVLVFAVCVCVCLNTWCSSSDIIQLFFLCNQFCVFFSLQFFFYKSLKLELKQKSKLNLINKMWSHMITVSLGVCDWNFGINWH